MGRILIGNVRGPQGIPGGKGDKGDTGARGPAGPPGSVDNTTPIEFTEAAQRENLVSGDSIATLFGKQKKWNADMLPMIEINYSQSTKEEALNKLNNPLSVFGANRNKPYYMLFNDSVGDSLLGGGIHCIYGYEISTQNYGIQLSLTYGTRGNKKILRIRSKYNGVWSDFFPVYNGLSALSPADIGAVSAGELTSRYKNYSFDTVGWHRVATIDRGSCNSCSISLKRNFSNNPNECHKVELVSLSDNCVFKSVYDRSNERLISKIRYVSVNNAGYIDIYYNAHTQNNVTVTVYDCINSSGISWKMMDSAIVQETVGGETVLATLEFKENSWLGGSDI